MSFLILFVGAYIDKKCPFTGTVSIRGRILAGTCHSAKMQRTIIVRRNYLHFVKKYQRWKDWLDTVFKFPQLTCVLKSSIECLISLLWTSRQIREKALKHSCSCFTVLPCQRRRSCYHWAMQVRDSNIYYLGFVQIHVINIFQHGMHDYE